MLLAATIAIICLIGALMRNPPSLVDAIAGATPKSRPKAAAVAPQGYVLAINAGMAEASGVRRAVNGAIGQMENSDMGQAASGGAGRAINGGAGQEADGGAGWTINGAIGQAENGGAGRKTTSAIEQAANGDAGRNASGDAGQAASGSAGQAASGGAFGGGARVSLSIADDSFTARRAEQLAEQLRQCGVEAKIKAYSETMLFSRAAAGKYELLLYPAEAAAPAIPDMECILIPY
jgi:hypothetical protein